MCSRVRVRVRLCVHACKRICACASVRMGSEALSRLAVEVAAIRPANLVHARYYTAFGGREDVLDRVTRGGEHRGSDDRRVHAGLHAARMF